MIRIGIAIAVIAAAIAAGWWGYSAAVSRGEAIGAAKSAQALQDARDAHASEIAALREDRAACEARIAVDAVLQRAAVAGYEARMKAVTAEAKARRKALAERMATPECKAWAKEPSCAP